MSEEYQYPINAFLPEFDPEEDVFKKQDPFAKKWEDLKGLSGLEKNFKSCLLYTSPSPRDS